MGGGCCARVAEWLYGWATCLWLFTPYLLSVIGLGLSLFFGVKASSIFWTPEKRQENLARSGGQVYVFWVNFMGSAVGWALFILIVSIVPRLDPKDPPWVYVVLFPLAVLGMAGVLPGVIFSLARGLHELIARLIARSLGGSP